MNIFARLSPCCLNFIKIRSQRKLRIFRDVLLCVISGSEVTSASVISCLTSLRPCHVVNTDCGKSEDTGVSFNGNSERRILFFQK